MKDVLADWPQVESVSGWARHLGYSMSTVREEMKKAGFAGEKTTAAVLYRQADIVKVFRERILRRIATPRASGMVLTTNHQH